MTESRVIPIVAGHAPLAVPAPKLATPSATPGHLHDLRGRMLHDLRISVTDRCNFRCSYCMPKEVFDKNYTYLPHQALLSFEEILRLAKAFVGLGVQKIRLTGGEPLLRKDIEVLVSMLAQLRTPQGAPLDLTLTTNGSLLAKKAVALKAAGLKRVTVSLDALDDAVFKRMNDMGFSVQSVLDGIEAARQVGLADKPGALKVNMVVQKGVNDDQIVPMAQFFKGQGISLRFIEYMDVGTTNGWRMDQVLPSSEVLARLRGHFKLVLAASTAPGETAERWVHANAAGQADAQEGEIGLISSVTKAFCRDCNRARLSTEGRLFLCLFAHQGYDLKPFVRGDSALEGTDGDNAIAQAITGIWQQRDDHYSEIRSQQLPTGRNVPKVEMSYIGG